MCELVGRERNRGEIQERVTGCVIDYRTKTRKKIIHHQLIHHQLKKKIIPNEVCERESGITESQSPNGICRLSNLGTEPPDGIYRGAIRRPPVHPLTTTVGN